MADETQDKKIHSRDLSVGLIQGMDRLSPTIIKTIDIILWLVAIFIGLIFLYLVAQILFFMLDISKHAAIDKFEDYQRLLLTFGSLIGAVTGVPFLIWRTMIAQKQNSIAQENIHSTTMAKAIEQLGAMKEEKITQDGVDADGNLKSETLTNSKPNIEVRLGAIYLLEKLAREHEQLHWPIMEILCAYVRENAGPPQVPPQEVIAAYAEPPQVTPEDMIAAYATPHKRNGEQNKLLAKREMDLQSPRVDIQAALTVIGRRSAKQLDWEKQLAALNNRAYRLDLSYCQLAKVKFDGLQFSQVDLGRSCLECANLSEIHLENANLFEAHLEGAWLGMAHLEGADLSYAHLEGTYLSSVHLEGAVLGGVHLEGAYLSAAHLEGVELSWAHLEGANLFQAHLEGANLFQAHLEGAHLREAHLEGAELSSSHLEGAGLLWAHLEGADLSMAHLKGAHLWMSHLEDARIDKADLREAKNVTQEMIDKTWGNTDTLLPDGIKHPKNERWEMGESDDNYERYERWLKRSYYWLEVGKKRASGEVSD